MRQHYLHVSGPAPEVLRLRRPPGCSAVLSAASSFFLSVCRSHHHKVHTHLTRLNADKKQLIPQQIHTQHSIINCIVPDWSFQCVGYQQRILYITSDHFPSHNLWVVRLTMDILWFIIYLTGFVSCWQSVTIKKYLALLLSSYISGQELSKKLRHFLWVFMVPSGLFYLMWWPCDLSPYCHYYNNRSYNWHVCGVN